MSSSEEKTYTVRWEVSVTAKTPKEAAEKARSVQLNLLRLHTFQHKQFIFMVTDVATESSSLVDLSTNNFT